MNINCANRGGIEVGSGLFEGLSQINGSASVKGTWHMKRSGRRKYFYACGVSLLGMRGRWA